MDADAGIRAARPLRLLLLVAALDSLMVGTWAVLRPDGLFAWLQVPPTPDGQVLCRALGVLTMAHAPCLVLAAL